MFILLCFYYISHCAIGFPVITVFCLLHFPKILKFSLCDVTEGLLY